jgi:hypothetical protein
VFNDEPSGPLDDAQSRFPLPQDMHHFCATLFLIAQLMFIAIEA